MRSSKHKTILLLATTAVATLVLVAVLVESPSSHAVSPPRFDATVEHTDKSQPLRFEPEVSSPAPGTPEVEAVTASTESKSEQVAVRDSEEKRKEWFPERVIMSEEGDTAYSLAWQYYGTRRLFGKIIDANPDLPWRDRLEAKMIVVLPEYDVAELDD